MGGSLFLLAQHRQILDHVLDCPQVARVDQDGAIPLVENERRGAVTHAVLTRFEQFFLGGLFLLLLSMTARGVRRIMRIPMIMLIAVVVLVTVVMLIAVVMLVTVVIGTRVGESACIRYDVVAILKGGRRVRSSAWLPRMSGLIPYMESV